MSAEHYAELAARIARIHIQQLALCDAIEEIADSLPDNVDSAKCYAVARALLPLIGHAQKVEETELFPLLERLDNVLPQMDHTLERLKFEHMEDLCFAEEVCEALLGFGCGRPELSAETTGYMLRGFYEGVRRHIAFETELLGPLVSLAWVPRRHRA